MRKCCYIVLLLLAIPLSLLAGRCSWWVFGPCGGQGENATGFTGGEPIIGEARGSSDISEVTYGYWFADMVPELCVSISHEDWYIDTLNVNETYTMLAGEEFIVTNCGNSNQNLGLQWLGCSPITWTIGYTTGINRFVARAKFTDSASPPDVFDYSLDYVRSSLTWCHGDEFGETGYSITPGSSTNLWLQFISPTMSDTWGANDITITLMAQTNIP